MNTNALETVLKPAELVEKIHAGNKPVESEFVKRYSRSLFLMLLKRTGGDEFAANECTQEALIITLEKMRSGKIRAPDQISAFLRQTAIYVSVNYYRKQSRFVALEEENIVSLRTHLNTAESEINSKQIRAILGDVISTLPIQRDRELLVSFYLREQGKKAVCESLDLSPEHFDRVLFRAKKRLRKILNNNKPLKAFLLAEVFEDVDEYE